MEEEWGGGVGLDDGGWGGGVVGWGRVEWWGGGVVEWGGGVVGWGGVEWWGGGVGWGRMVG